MNSPAIAVIGDGKMGRTIAEMVGRVEMLKVRTDLPPGKVRSLDLSALLYKDTQPHYSIKNELTPTAKTLQSAVLLNDLLDKKLLAATYDAVHFDAVDQVLRPLFDV